MVFAMQCNTMCVKVVRAGGCIGALLAAILFFSGCHARNRQEWSQEWSVGYWTWGEWNQHESPSAQPVDLVAVDIGQLGCSAHFHKGEMIEGEPSYDFESIEPNDLPAAKRYVAVVRMNVNPFDKKDAVTPVIKRFKRLHYRFQEIHRQLDEIQLDFDCPTASLSKYAGWLEQWRRQLPPGTRLTITALLDWFNEGTAIGQVLSKVDGYVPQFYDVDVHNDDKAPKIAYFPDHVKWGPIFERFKVPYQIGLSTFGRIQFTGHGYYCQNAPLNLLSRLKEAPNISINRSGERVFDMTFRDESNSDERDDCTPPMAIGIMIQPTAESVLRGYREAQSMGRYCAGVLFFRWPAKNESLALKPDEISAIISGKAPNDGYSLESIDGECALTDCHDLSLMQQNRFPGNIRTIAVKSSVPLEYFLSGKELKSTMINAHEMQFQIPPYNAATKIFLGRAVAAQPAEYTIRVIQ
jgi:hypothetical protein